MMRPERREGKQLGFVGPITEWSIEITALGCLNPPSPTATLRLKLSSHILIHPLAFDPIAFMRTTIAYPSRGFPSLLSAPREGQSQPGTRADPGKNHRGIFSFKRMYANGSVVIVRVFPS
ncbi:hypothetical protein CRG98_024493 [Punica granatum]|uniref:Uncharacterized protein n=1 Tax=Punica granatum TaxID=22663 RepID=A0A2I0JG19_PUNGR|nr:hypothetical protein CRG98_024493 [Punica granatum]